MGQVDRLAVKRRQNPRDLYSQFERLIAENRELRTTAAELALQTAVLRERLSGRPLLIARDTLASRDVIRR